MCCIFIATDRVCVLFGNIRISPSVFTPSSSPASFTIIREAAAELSVIIHILHYWGRVECEMNTETYRLLYHTTFCACTDV